MTVFLYDASAVVAFMMDEPGFAVIKEHLTEGGAISAINATEVVNRLIRDGIAIDRAIDKFDQLDLVVVPFDREAAYGAAALEPLTRSRGLSLADRACLTVARLTELPVLTTDSVWAELDQEQLGVEIVLAR